MALSLPLVPLMLSVVLTLTGCSLIPAWSDETKSLYDELGQQQGIDRLNETLILAIARDPRINHFFKDADIGRFHRMLGEHLCDLSGGPCQYRGDSMRLVHAGMGVDEAAFNALVEDLIMAMEYEGLSVGIQNRLLQRLAPLHEQVVNVPLPAPFGSGSDMRDIDPRDGRDVSRLPGQQ